MNILKKKKIASKNSTVTLFSDYLEVGPVHLSAVVAGVGKYTLS